MHMCGLCVHVGAGVCVHVYDLYVCTVGLGTDTRFPDRDSMPLMQRSESWPPAPLQFALAPSL